MTPVDGGAAKEVVIPGRTLRKRRATPEPLFANNIGIPGSLAGARAPE
jgi:hypothetical protein